MRDNQEMASILFNSGLATEEQLTSHWHEITAETDIGQLLVNYGILLPKVYADLLVYIDSLHPNQPAAEPEIDTDSIIIPADEIGGIDDLPGGPFDGGTSFDDQLFDGSDSIDRRIDEDTYQGVVEAEPARVSAGDFDIPAEAFVVDLDDIEPHVDEYDNGEFGSLPLGDSFFTAGSDGSVPASVISEERIKTASKKSEPAVHAAHGHESTYSGPHLPDFTLGTRDIGELHVTVPAAVTPANSLDEILMYARANAVSDVHLIAESPITMRRYGALVPVSAEILTAPVLEKILRSGLPSDKIEMVVETGDCEFVYTISGGGRFRVTIMRLRSGWSFTARIIPFTIPDSAAIGLPKSAETLTKWAQGLVLVTGPAGCGKSTTLASLVEMINRDRNEHIITIENPIETVFPAGQSQICQREVGMHTLTQDNALRGALRQDPDILMVSELRDMDSIQLAVSAAETGHLVFGTMNTINASRTIYRLIESFPADEQDVIRNMVSESLRGVISQQLVPKADGTGVVPVFEVLLVTQAVANMIRKNEMHQLMSAMITGRNQGMILFDDSLMQLVKDGVVSPEEAVKRSNDPEPFKQMLKKGGE